MSRIVPDIVAKVLLSKLNCLDSSTLCTEPAEELENIKTFLSSQIKSVECINSFVDLQDLYQFGVVLPDDLETLANIIKQLN